jgi:hypothetical protein
VTQTQISDILLSQEKTNPNIKIGILIKLESDQEFLDKLIEINNDENKYMEDKRINQRLQKIDDYEILTILNKIYKNSKKIKINTFLKNHKI